MSSRRCDRPINRSAISDIPSDLTALYARDVAEGETLNHYVPRSDMEDSVILLSLLLLQALPSNAIGSGYVSHLI